MLNVSLKELKLVAKSRGIKGYRSMSKERLLSAISELELVESKNSFDHERLEKMRKDFNELRDRFTKEIRKKCLWHKNPKKSFSPKNKTNWTRFSNLKKYHPQYDFEHRNIRDIRNFLNRIAFNQSIDEGCYKPVKTTDKIIA